MHLSGVSSDDVLERTLGIGGVDCRFGQGLRYNNFCFKESHVHAGPRLRKQRSSSMTIIRARGEDAKETHRPGCEVQPCRGKVVGDEALRSTCCRWTSPRLTTSKGTIPAAPGMISTAINMSECISQITSCVIHPHLLYPFISHI